MGHNARNCGGLPPIAVQVFALYEDAQKYCVLEALWKKIHQNLLHGYAQTTQGRKYANPTTLNSVGTLAPDGSYCGHSFAQHNPNGSFAFLHGGQLKTIPKMVMKWHRETQGGIFQVYKRSIVDEQHNLFEKITIKMDGASYLPGRPKDLGARFCTDLLEVHPRKLDEIVHNFQKTFEEIGGPWMLSDGQTYNSQPL